MGVPDGGAALACGPCAETLCLFAPTAASELELGCTVQLERLLRGALPTSDGQHVVGARAPRRGSCCNAVPLCHPALGVMQEGGWGLHNVLRDAEWKLKGIVNGMDYSEWSPQADVFLKVGRVWCTACNLPPYIHLCTGCVSILVHVHGECAW